MPEPGKKRPHDDDDEPSGSKRSRGDEAGAVHVYQPCVVLPELEKKMNSLVEVAPRRPNHGPPLQRDVRDLRLERWDYCCITFAMSQSVPKRRLSLRRLQLFTFIR